MTIQLFIKVAFDTSVSHLVGKTLELDDVTAKEYHIKQGEVGVLFETEDFLKVTYRGSMVKLPKDKIRVRNVEDKGLFDFGGAQ